LLVLDSINLSVGIRGLLGSSGCGESTLLRLISGLEHPSKDSIAADSVTIDRPAKSRILVFQDPTLFPWATVWNNVATGLDARGALAAQRSRVDPALDIVGLRAFACLSRPAGPEDFWVIASALVPLARRPHYLVAVRPG
jgi:ABC-type nitrate/sulfonate/bicarbonate transport system ATPase subunit